MTPTRDAPTAGTPTTPPSPPATTTARGVDRDLRGGLLYLAGVAGTTWLALVGGLLAVALALPLLPGWSSHVVLTGSMMPHVRPGDVVVSAPPTPGDLVVGRVVTATRPGRLPVTHRVVEVGPGGLLTTQGDANPSPDPFAVRPEQVLGTGRVLVPYVGLPTLWLQRGELVALLLAAASVTLAYLAHRSEPRPARSSRDDEHADDAADQSEERP